MRVLSYFRQVFIKYNTFEIASGMNKWGEVNEILFTARQGVDIVFSVYNILTPFGYWSEMTREVGLTSLVFYGGWWFIDGAADIE